MGTAAAEGRVAGSGKTPDGAGITAPWPMRLGVVITSVAILGLALRLFRLSRPGYLSGFTQYDDGVYFGNAVRFVHGAIAYRNFAMVQPPASMLLMAPVALAAKVAGTAWGLGAARLLTALADTANVVLIGLLVRHRGALAAGLACAGPGSPSVSRPDWLSRACRSWCSRRAASGVPSSSPNWSSRPTGGSASSFRGKGDVPRGGLYVRM